MSTTIYDVAKHAGVSTATVSKVLSGHPYVSEQTRARVVAAVRELNYVPNAAARGLAGARTNIIGMVVSYTSDDLFADPHLLQILRGINSTVNEYNCALLLSTATSGEDKLSAYQRLLGQRYADGAIVEGSLGEVGLSLLRERGYPVVAVGYSELISCVHSDDTQGARQITEHLLELGHRQIGVITTPPSERHILERRLAGYKMALAQTGLTFDPTLVIEGNYRRQSGYEGAAELMAHPTPPTAIFAFNDRMALGAIQYVTEQGMSVPHDISVAGYDDIPDAARADVPLTTVRQLAYKQGEEAVRLLFHLIQNESESATRAEVALETQLIVRDSTARPGARL